MKNDRFFVCVWFDSFMNLCCADKLFLNRLWRMTNRYSGAQCGGSRYGVITAPTPAPFPTSPRIPHHLESISNTQDRAIISYQPRDLCKWFMYHRSPSSLFINLYKSHQFCSIRDIGSDLIDNWPRIHNGMNPHQRTIPMTCEEIGSR
jgi:hypothetical protein